MTPFAPELQVSPYIASAGVWYLDTPLVYTYAAGFIKIPAGFETDFASVPTLFTVVLPRWGDYGEASVLHDWLYWNQQLPRAAADGMFRDAMQASGVAAWKRYVLYFAVRWFGAAAWRSNLRIAKAGFSRVRTENSPSFPMWNR